MAAVNAIRGVRGVVLSALVILLTALAAETLRLADGTPPLVWPAAAAAFIVIRAGGFRLWPVVTVALFLYQLLVLPPGMEPVASVLSSVAFGLVGALQASLAVLVMLRYRDAVLNGELRRIVIGAVLVGPLACLVKPLLTAAIGLAAGTLPAASFAAFSFTAWVAEILGLVLFAPIILLLVPAIQRAYGARGKLIAVPMLCGAALVSALLVWNHAQDRRALLASNEVSVLNAFDGVQARASLALASTHFAGSLLSRSGDAANSGRVLAGRMSPLLDGIAVRIDGRTGFEPVHGSIPATVIRALSLSTAVDTVDDGRLRVIEANEGAARAVFVLPLDGVEAGSVVGVASLRNLIEPLERAAETGDLDFRLLDATGKVQASTRGGGVPEAGERWTREIGLPEGSLTLVASLAADAWTPSASRSSVVLSILLVSGVMLFLVLVLANAGHRVRIEAQIADRTAALNRKRTQLEAALDISCVIFWEVDAEQRRLHLDERFMQLLGTTAEREGGLVLAVTDFVERFVHPDDRGSLLALTAGNSDRMNRIRRTGLEYRLLRRDGRIRYVVAKMYLGPSEVSAGGLWLGTTQDITERREAELALQRSEVRNRGIVESSQDCIKVLDLSGRILEMTESGQRLMDVDDPAQVIGLYWPDVWIREPDREAVQVALQAARDGRTGRFTGQAETFAGESKWWNVVVTPIPGADGAPAQLLAVSRDISAEVAAREAVVKANERLEETVRERTEALRESERRYRDVFERNPLPMWTFDPDTLAFVDVNEATLKQYGYTREEFAGMTLFDIRPDSENERLREYIRNRTPGMSRVADVRHRRKGGSELTVDIASSAMIYAGREVRIAVANDVSERREAEVRLHHQKELNRLLLENLAEGVVACDEHGELILFNRTAREWHGADPMHETPEQWAGKFDLFEADGLVPLAEDRIPLRRALAGETVREWPMSIRRKGHDPRVVMASGAPLFDSDGVRLGAVITMRDVTESRRAQAELENTAAALKSANEAVRRERESLVDRVEERTVELVAANAALAEARDDAEAASRAKSAFLATMSHEIRTPMNGIVGMVELLARDRLSAEQASAITTIRLSADALLGIIDDILDFSKIEAGRIELERVPLNLEDLVESVCTPLAAVARKADVDLDLFVDPALPDGVWGDPTRLRQVLNNLVGNAIKFSGRRTRRGVVRVSVEPEAGRDDRIRLMVADNGIGMDPAKVPMLFESFSQAESTTTREYGGTGLGLAICKRLIDLMGGRIDVETAPGAGATFSVSLGADAVELGGAPPVPSLDGVVCRLVVSGRGNADTWLARYLHNAGATVNHVAPVDLDGHEVAIGRGRPVTIWRDSVLAETGLDPLQVYPGDGHVVLRDSDAAAGAADARLRELDGNAVARRDLLRIVHELSDADGCSPVAVSAPADAAANVAEKPNQLAGVRVLVAEDDVTNQAVVRRQLAVLGCEATVVGDGQQALQALKADRFDVILSDLHMPVLDGYGLIRAIRDGGHKLPVLAFTADALRGESQRALAAGFDAYLTKPIRLDALGEALTIWVGSGPGAGQRRRAKRPAGVDLIDRAAVAAIVGDDEEMIRDTMEAFVDAAPGFLSEMQEAQDRSSHDAVRRVCHRLKSAARTVGAGRLADRCESLERKREPGQAELLRRCAEIESALAQTVSAIGQQVDDEARAMP